MNINSEFETLIPSLSNEEFEQLEQSILQNGLLDEIKTCFIIETFYSDTYILDGHNRYKICLKNNIEPKFSSPIKFQTFSDAKIWIIKNQFGRRNISSFVRAELALKLKNELALLAKQRQFKGVLQNSGEGKENDTDRLLAKTASVSHDTIHRVEKILASDDEELIDKCRAGSETINSAYKKLNPHVSHNSGEEEWYTPSRFICAARETMGEIDLDPASCELANRTIVRAKTFYTKETDGLSQEWFGKVWLNPPYSQPLIEHFCYKLVNSNVQQYCVLVNNGTETKWFQMLLNKSHAICFPNSRIRFHNPYGKSGSPLQGQAILYFGQNVSNFLKNFSQFGESFELPRFP